MRRGIEYSPIGLLYTLGTGFHAVKTGKITQNQFIDSLASGMTGTGLAVLGGFLQSLGMLKLGMKDKRDTFGKLGGEQEYSIELFGQSYTIDWMSPSAMPLFVGGAINRLMNDENGEGMTMDSVCNAMLDITEPVFNLSMLDGVNNLLSSARSSDNGVAQIAARAGENLVSQFIPSVFGAIARTIDPVRRKTYAEKNGMPSGINYLLSGMLNKLPGLSQKGQPYLNAWGEEDVTENVVQRALENFAFPGYLNQVESDDVERGLLELFDRTGETGLVPKLLDKYFTVNGERRDLTGAEYTRFAKERGQTAHGLLEALLASDMYRQADDPYKVKIVADVWGYATQTAKHGIDERFVPESWVQSADDPAQAILARCQEAMDADKAAGFKAYITEGVEAGDAEQIATGIQGLVSMGRKTSDIRSMLTTNYKKAYIEMYQNGDVAGMANLRGALIAAGVGYDEKTFLRWLKEE